MPRSETPSPRVYDALRAYVPPRRREAVPAPVEDHRVRVLEWLGNVGHAIARKLRPALPTPLTRIHARR